MEHYKIILLHEVIKKIKNNKEKQETLLWQTKYCGYIQSVCLLSEENTSFWIKKSWMASGL